MKILRLVFAIAALMAFHGFAAVYNKEVWYARDKGADVDVFFKIVDDGGAPVCGAKCSGWIYLERDRTHGCGYTKYTDTNGCVRVTGKCSEWFRIAFEKEGFYATLLEVKYPGHDIDTPIIDGKWQPYGETRTIVLKRIKKPFKVKVFSESSHRHRIPVFDQWIGYDLENGDWIPPYGSGKFNDVAIRFKADVRERRNNYTYVMDISFTNNPFGGAYVMKKDTSSCLQTEYVADTNGNYRADFTFTTESESNKPVVSTCLGQDSYLVFRTRTRVDGHGRLIGGHYGKICGVWRSTSNIMQISDGCFNPIENDSNIEGSLELLFSLKNNKCCVQN